MDYLIFDGGEKSGRIPRVDGICTIFSPNFLVQIFFVMDQSHHLKTYYGLFLKKGFCLFLQEHQLPISLSLWD